jgi:hypothetical protein
VLVTVSVSVFTTRLLVSKLIETDAESEPDTVDEDCCGDDCRDKDCDVEDCDDEASVEPCTLETELLDDDDDDPTDCVVEPEEVCDNAEVLDCD